MAKTKKPLTAKYLGISLSSGEEISAHCKATRDDFMVVQRGYPIAFASRGDGWAPVFQTTRYQRRRADGHRWTKHQRIMRRHLVTVSTGFEIGDVMRLEDVNVSGTLTLVAKESLWRLWQARKR